MNGLLPPDEKTKVRRKNFRVTRDLVLRIGGTIGILHEEFFSTTEKPTLIILYGAMIGLPAFLHLDAKRRGEED